MAGCVQRSFVAASLRHVLPWCMAVHFNTRVFAQAAVLSLWPCISHLQHNEAVGDQSIYQAIDVFMRTNR